MAAKMAIKVLAAVELFMTVATFHLVERDVEVVLLSERPLLLILADPFTNIGRTYGLYNNN